VAGTTPQHWPQPVSQCIEGITFNFFTVPDTGTLDLHGKFFQSTVELPAAAEIAAP
jgi:hypothetical protein